MIFVIYSKLICVIKVEKKVILFVIIGFFVRGVLEDIVRLGCYSNRVLVFFLFGLLYGLIFII